MPRSTKTGTDFEGRVFDLLIDRLDKQDEALKDILTQVRYTNGKVIKLRSDVDALQRDVQAVPKKKDLPEVLRDPKVLQVALYLSLAALLLVATFTGFDLTGLL